METQNLHIKNMICPRCIFVVQDQLTSLGAKILHIELGYVITMLPLNLSTKEIENKLREFGFELVEDKESVLVERIKVLILDYLQLLESISMIIKMSDYLTREIGKNYNYLSKIFSKYESVTIENYFINKRISRVKELLINNELNVSEIASLLRYSSVHYLSSQFKKVTGLSISEYKNQIKAKHEKYNDISEAISDLNNQGFEYEFIKKGDQFICESQNLTVSADEVEILGEIHFPRRDPTEFKVTVYKIKTRIGYKGIYLDIPDNINNSRTSIICNI